MAPPDAGAQALLVVAHPFSGATSSTAATTQAKSYRDLATDVWISTTTVDRYVCAALELLAAIAPSRQAIDVARERSTSSSTGFCCGSTGSP